MLQVQDWMKCLNLPLLLSVSSVPVLYAARLTSLSVPRLHHYPYCTTISDVTWYLPCFSQLAANLSLIHSFTIVEYTNTEYSDMVLVYGDAAGNRRAAHRICQERYPHHVTPSHILFAKVIQRLRERGTFTVDWADCGAPKRRCTPNFEEDLRHRVEETRQKVCLHELLLVERMCLIVPSGRFCMSSNYIVTIPRGYMQWV